MHSGLGNVRRCESGKIAESEHAGKGTKKHADERRFSGLPRMEFLMACDLREETAQNENGAPKSAA
jgi:hypothetical protein